MLSEKSAQFAEMQQGWSVRYTNAAQHGVASPGSTRIADPRQLDLLERAEESFYVEADRPR